MLIEEIIGRTITNIYCLYGLQDGWLDTAECFVELDNALYIDIPSGAAKDVWEKDLNQDAVPVFNEKISKDPPPYPVTYYEDKRKHFLNSTIVDYLWGDDEFEKGFIKLDNGYLISEKTMAPSGTGQAGLKYYESIEQLKQIEAGNMSRLYSASGTSSTL